VSTAHVGLGSPLSFLVMAQLSSFTFTASIKAPDNAVASSLATTGGWQNTAATPIQALAGDDIISSIGAFADLGAVGTTAPVFGSTAAYYATPPTAAPSLYSAAIANGGNGVIDMGAGRDTLSGTTSGLRSIGILNGKIGGANTTEKIAMGAGDDTIVGLNFSATSANTYAIYNTGTIDLGDGKDLIQGTKLATVASGAAIYNSGTIQGGAGDDTFDAITGGWAGNGKVDGGAGIDCVMGFGSGTFDGGTGVKDSLILPEGSYSVKYAVKPTASTATFGLTRNGDTGIVMNCTGFEAINTINPAAPGLHPQAIGGLRLVGFVIDAAGLITTQTFASNALPLPA